MFKLKQEITNLTDGVLNENIYVKDGKAFIKNADGEFMYDGVWFVKAGDKWIDLQGGMPVVDNVEFVDIATIKNMDSVVLAVAHTEFTSFSMNDIDNFFGQGQKVLLDIKGLLNRKEYENAGYLYWRL